MKQPSTHARTHSPKVETTQIATIERTETAYPQAEYNNEREQTTSTSNLDKPYKCNG